jgi:hypothetical protein
VKRSAAWLKANVVSVKKSGDPDPIHVIAWKDPTLVPDDPKLLAGYVITDTLWAAKALKVVEPETSRLLERDIERLGWAGNGLHDVLFHPLERILHRPDDADIVHGFSLGRAATDDGRTVDLRVFREKWDAAYEVGHPKLFAEHAAYHALFEFWQGHTNEARKRLRDALKDDRATDPSDRLFWDAKTGIVVDYVNYNDWTAFTKNERPVCRHYTFKLGVLLYAIRLVGIADDPAVPIAGMKDRLWSAQTESGGLAHFVDIHHDGRITTGKQPTGEASSIAILSEIVEAVAARRPSER